MSKHALKKQCFFIEKFGIQIKFLLTYILLLPFLVFVHVTVLYTSSSAPQ